PTPCLALRMGVSRAPGGEGSYCFAVGERTPEEAGALEAEGLAAARSRVQRRMLGVQAGQWADYARLAGFLLYRRPAPAPARLRELWALGVSGDEPLLAR
ncbi:MAG: hypothetical protein IJ157_12790, partial [Clostridia bacterium]|nr:hypothetical protein [Clostridia bacterium]